MATVPSQRSWTVNEIVTAAMLNDDVRDAINFFLTRPAFRLVQTTTQTLTTATQTDITFPDAEILDNDAAHSVVTNTARYTGKTPGYFDVFGCVVYVNNVTGTRAAGLRINGATFAGWQANPAPGGTVAGACAISQKVFLDGVDDWVTVWGFQNSGGNLDTSTSNGGSQFSGTWAHN